MSEWGSSTGGPEGYVKEGCQGGHICPQGPRQGTGKGAYLPGTWKDGWRRAVETERLSLWELCKGNLQGGLLYWLP